MSLKLIVLHPNSLSSAKCRLLLTKILGSLIMRSLHFETHSPQNANSSATKEHSTVDSLITAEKKQEVAIMQWISQVYNFNERLFCTTMQTPPLSYLSA